MNIALPYGRGSIALELPDDTFVLQSRYFPGLADEPAALRASLRAPIGAPPLPDQVRPGHRVVVVHSDITRATPNDRILPVLLAELESCGVERADITLLNGLGTHRRQTEAEQRFLLGDFVVDNYRCLQHDCSDDENLVSLGVTSLGHPVRLNRLYVEADFRILTGFIEPHFFAGFSGGPKGVLPSIAGAESVLTNHGYRMIANPHASWGVTAGNPIWEEMSEVALRLQPVFLLNVALNRDRQISAVFAGDLVAAFEQGCEFVRSSAMVPLNNLYDVVLTTNGGYPLDQNLYQALKGISAAGRAVNPGGAIVMFSACEDGLPEHGLYAHLLRQAGSPQQMLQILSAPGFSAPDQWQVQIQAQVLLDHPVFIYSDGLTDSQILAAHYLPCRDVAATLTHLRMKYGSHSRLCVMPEGPQTVPYAA